MSLDFETPRRLLLQQIANGLKLPFRFILADGLPRVEQNAVQRDRSFFIEDFRKLHRGELHLLRHRGFVDDGDGVHSPPLLTLTSSQMFFPPAGILVVSFPPPASTSTRPPFFAPSFSS